MPSLPFKRFGWRSDSQAPTTLYAELVRRGLPADYARRTADELDDHRADLIADLRSLDGADPEAVARERLGEKRQLARKIAADYRRRSWFGRWPLVAFVLAPIPLWIVSSMAVHAVLLAIAYPVNAIPGASFDGLSPWKHLVADVALVMSLYTVFFAVVPSLVSYGIAKLALRTTQQRLWAVVASGVIAFATASLTYKMNCSLEPGQSSLYVNSPAFTPDRFDPWTTVSSYLRPVALAEMAGPVLACLLVLRSDAKRRRAAFGVESNHGANLPLAA